MRPCPTCIVQRVLASCQVTSRTGGFADLLEERRVGPYGEVAGPHGALNKLTHGPNDIGSLALHHCRRRQRLPRRRLGGGADGLPVRGIAREAIPPRSPAAHAALAWAGCASPERTGLTHRKDDNYVIREDYRRETLAHSSCSRRRSISSPKPTGQTDRTALAGL